MMKKNKKRGGSEEPEVRIKKGKKRLCKNRKANREQKDRSPSSGTIQETHRKRNGKEAGIRDMTAN